MERYTASIDRFKRESGIELSRGITLEITAAITGVSRFYTLRTGSSTRSKANPYARAGVRRETNAAKLDSRGGQG